MIELIDLEARPIENGLKTEATHPQAAAYTLHQATPDVKSLRFGS